MFMTERTQRATFKMPRLIFFTILLIAYICGSFFLPSSIALSEDSQTDTVVRDEIPTLINVSGRIESTLGGFKFPDGTIQATAAGGSGGSFANWFNATDMGGIANAINACLAADGGTVYLPAGSWNVSAALPTITKGMRILGAGTHDTNGSIISSTMASGNVFEINTDDAVIVENMRINGPGSGTATAIKATSSSGNNMRSQFSNLTIDGFYRSIHLAANNIVGIHDCYFMNTVQNDPGAAHIYVENASNPDTGDSTIYACTFSGTYGYAIFQRSGGGLRIQNNKFLDTWCSSCNCVRVELTPSGRSINTSVFVFDGNSLEGSSNVNDIYSMAFVCNADPSYETTFQKIIISDNEIHGGKGFYFGTTHANATLGNCVISGNEFNGMQIYMEKVAGTLNNFLINSNIFVYAYQQPVNAVVNSNATNVYTCGNLYYNYSTPEIGAVAACSSVVATD